VTATQRQRASRRFLSDAEFLDWRTAMSVMVIVKFPGAHVDKFKAVFDRHTELMSAISADGRSKGAIHHQFVEDENGDAMVVDEWGSLAEFDAFFSAQEDIKKIVAEFGLTGQPTVVSYQILDTADRF
jgi:heme-degrading monooxygenase HmoA